MPTYLTIGHISRDITQDGPRLGGTVTFSALTAAALGCEVRILTSASPAETALLRVLRDFDLHIVPSETPTSFRNTYTPTGRQQRLLSQATLLRGRHLPTGWATTHIVHIAPIAQEIEPTILNYLSPDSVRILTPQGYLRQWAADGTVAYAPWKAAPEVLAYCDAVVLSIEDVNNDETAAQEMAKAAPLGLITRAENGATLLIDNYEEHTLPAPHIDVTDPTGAGDVLAACFAVRLYQTGDPIRAAQFAIFLASDSVSRSGLASIPTSQAITQAYSHY